MPIYGKVSDLYGRKPVMLFGITLFLVGSLLCGLAWSMGALIAFRALQGLGAGAVQPVGMTIVGDIYSVAERATVQGYLAAVWAISSLVGPTLGRRVRRLRVVALDLPGQPPAGPGRGLDAVAPVRGGTPGPRPRANPAQGRRPGHAAAAPGHRGAARGPARGRGDLGVGLTGERGAARGIGAHAGGVRVRRAARGRAGAAAVGVPAPGGRDGDGRLARRRGADARADVVRAAVRAGGARHRRDRGGVRPGGDDDRLADRGGDVGPALPAVRVPHDDADRLAHRARRRRTAAHHRRLELGAAPRGPQLRHGPRLRLRLQSGDHRGPVVGRLARSGGWRPARPSSPARSAAPSGWPRSAPSRTPSSTPGSAASRPTSSRCRRGCSTRPSTPCSSRRSRSR